MTRIAIVKKSECNPIGCGDYLCAKLCPINRKGEACIKPDPVSGKALIDETLCIGCGICPNRCPFEAIDIINLPEALNKDPIHRFGDNGFSLFSLPTPIFGKVVGVVGVNGIGKSTAIKILAGQLVPNLGHKEVASYEELLDYFKGTEAQRFFEKVRDREIVVSYKPQQVENIPKAFKGKTEELLRKSDQTGRFDEIVDALDLRKILDTPIENISGGELQRVAIAASVMKKANLYIFDEPTSYLDIKQRLKVSRFLRELANEETAVLVIEHDLIILDFITDLVHIMYGKQGGYGIVSQPKATRVGINVFLEGYLQEENVRFRDYEIKFSARPEMVGKETPTQVSWKGITKQLGRFTLTAGEGRVQKNDVIGILGENGIGKTSFVKLLAGVEKADNGEIDKQITVSYKPQYIETSDDLVMNVLGEAVEKYETTLIDPLNIKPLLMKNVNHLSGGELQRVAICACLSKKADLYLLDEPSAYLDVEQRILISKIIADFMEQKGTSAMVVDHDLLFIDYLSRKLLVFDGEPAVSGVVKGPFSMQEGMNNFLRDLNMTFRRDPDSNRPRANKPESQMDRQQKAENKLYYI